MAIEAREGGACPGSNEFCFEVVEGNVADIGPGTQVEIIFRNDGAATHTLDVTTYANRDPGHTDTSPDGELAGSGDISGGDATTIQFTVPADAEGIYFWCDVSGHEQLGMWMESSFSGQEGSPVSDPAPSFVAASLAVVALAVILLRRRSA
jgi:hypothetical protein